MTMESNMGLLSKYQEFVADGYSNPSATKEMKLMNAALGLVGEAGEVADLIKKKLHEQKVPKHKFEEEIGDVLWYLTHLCVILNLNLEDILKLNYVKLYYRYDYIHGGKDYGIEVD